MTSLGRGRGWSNIKDRESMLRRPGTVISPKAPEYHSLIQEIENLDIHSSAPPSKIEDIKSLIITAADSKNLQAVFETLHTQALEDRQFGIKLGVVLGNNQISNLQLSDGTKLRNILLSTLQNDYERKDEIKAASMPKYLNAVSLLGEIHYRLKLAIDGGSLHCIGRPLLDCMRTLLETAAEDDIEVVVTQLSINGRKIYNRFESDLEQFLTHVRTVLVNRNLSARSRGMLLLAIDLANQRYGPLPGELQAFYLAQLGMETMMQIQRHNELLTIITKSKDQPDAQAQVRKKVMSQDGSSTDQTSTQNNSDTGILTRAPEPDRSIKYDTFDQKSYSPSTTHAVNSSTSLSSSASGAPIPRAIRGSGAREDRKDHRNDKKSPRGKKDRLTDEQVWKSKQDNTSKSWGHDDRFDRDYESDNLSSGQKNSEKGAAWD